MKRYRILKRIRVIISLMFLVLLGLFFLDFTGIFPTRFIKGVIYLQFVPSLLKFFNVFSWIATGFIVILLLTLVFGRVYCSTICPLGVLQDVVSYIRRRIHKKKRHRYLKPRRWLRYGILALSVAFLAGGSILIVALLDPYSLFGRIISDLFRPLATQGNNLVAGILNQFDIYSVYHVDLHPIHIGILTIPIVFLILVVWLSFTRGRLYCNTVCPVGTFLGLVSKISLFQIRLNPSTCTKCGLCERKCKGGCIETTTQRVEFSRCVGCFNCLEVCPFDSAEYSLNPLYQKAQVQENPNPTPHQTDGSKRKFLASLALVFFSVTKISKAQELVSHSATTPINRKNPVSPPGSQSIDRFNDSCTACNLCVNVCPTQVLQPSLLEYGLRGLMQPHLDFHAGYCNYECVLCSEVCPTGAILPLNVEEKKLTQMGQTHFVKENCIVETEGTACGACAETCPTQAVAMVDYKNNLKIPEVTNDICIGCGACENSCPTLPYKAIYVEGNPLHQQAEEPDKKQVEKAKSEEEFPF